MREREIMKHWKRKVNASVSGGVILGIMIAQVLLYIEPAPTIGVTIWATVLCGALGAYVISGYVLLRTIMKIDRATAGRS